MDPLDDAELARLKAIHAKAVDWEWETRKDLFKFLQDKMKTGKQGILTELIGKTGYSRQRLGDIKAGKWSRNPKLNPKD